MMNQLRRKLQDMQALLKKAALPPARMCPRSTRSVSTALAGALAVAHL